MLMRAVFISLALGLFIHNVSAQDLAAVQAETIHTKEEANKYWAVAKQAATPVNEKVVIETQKACIELIQAEEARIAATQAWLKAKHLKNRFDIAAARLELIGDSPPPAGDPNRAQLIATCRTLTRKK